MTAQIADSKYQPAILLRKAIIKTQSAEITQMNKLLVKLGAKPQK